MFITREIKQFILLLVLRFANYIPKLVHAHLDKPGKWLHWSETQTK